MMDLKVKVVTRKNKPVEMFNMDGIFIRQFDSIKSASDYTGINKSSISYVCNRMQNQAGGYKWKFVNKEDILR